MSLSFTEQRELIRKEAAEARAKIEAAIVEGESERQRLGMEHARRGVWERCMAAILSGPLSSTAMFRDAKDARGLLCSFVAMAADVADQLTEEYMKRFYPASQKPHVPEPAGSAEAKPSNLAPGAGSQTEV